MTTLLGEYAATLDVRGRFLFPVGLKNQLPEPERERFVINRGFETCLTLYPHENLGSALCKSEWVE
jgi:MraZ protein